MWHSMQNTDSSLGTRALSSYLRGINQDTPETLPYGGESLSTMLLAYQHGLRGGKEVDKSSSGTTFRKKYFCLGVFNCKKRLIVGFDWSFKKILLA